MTATSLRRRPAPSSFPSVSPPFPQRFRRVSYITNETIATPDAPFVKIRVTFEPLCLWSKLFLSKTIGLDGLVTRLQYSAPLGGGSALSLLPPWSRNSSKGAWRGVARQRHRRRMDAGGGVALAHHVGPLGPLVLWCFGVGSFFLGSFKFP